MTQARGFCEPAACSFGGQCPAEKDEREPHDGLHQSCQIAQQTLHLLQSTLFETSGAIAGGSWQPSALQAPAQGL